MKLRTLVVYKQRRRSQTNQLSLTFPRNREQCDQQQHEQGITFQVYPPGQGQCGLQ